MAQQAGSSLWMTVGGATEPDESPSDAAVREMWVETGLHMVPVRVLGVFGGREFRVSYPNGDEAAYTVILFEVRLLGGRLRADGEEAAALRYVTAEEADALPRSNLTRILVRTSFARPGAAYFMSPTWAPPEARRLTRPREPSGSLRWECWAGRNPFRGSTQHHRNRKRVRQ